MFRVGRLRRIRGNYGSREDGSYILVKEGLGFKFKKKFCKNRKYIDRILMDG